ncbi:hypothetical protein [Pseudomonas sp. RL_15y_Pfl2_60]|uniref:hypothetical protein n=1 Tax=Pseudomonas sp. RL_15y_Pfl2_60 TaxID=3088709 RepID=UPI0030DB8F6B
MLNGISNLINRLRLHLDMGPVAALVMQHLNIKTGQQSCSESEVAEFLGYSCAPMPLCG